MHGSGDGGEVTVVKSLGNFCWSFDTIDVFVKNTLNADVDVTGVEDGEVILQVH